MQIIIKPFNDLTPRELHDIYRLRARVFVVEQNCVYQDVDDKDPDSYHLMLFEQDELAAYCRALPPGLSYSEPSIGRVVVDPGHRGKAYGKAIMKECLRKMREMFGEQDIVISAQSYLIKFYSELGFKAEGEEYEEDNIPHIQMRFSYLR